MEKPYNKSGFQSQQSSATVSSPHEQSSNNQVESENTGIASMLSPRNIMKMFTKNVQEIVSPRMSLFLGTPHENTRYFSNVTEQQVMTMFGTYLNSVSKEIIKYKNYQAKKAYAQSVNDQNKKNREQIEYEVKISRIPEQYFQDWEHQLNQQQLEQSKLDININTDQDQQQQTKHTHKSLKLQTLLAMGPSSSSKKLSKQKKRSLLQKQVQLEQHLDQIELIIYTKTQKYPDRYLHYLFNLNDSDLQVSSLQDKVREIRVKLKQVTKHVQGKFRKVGQLAKKKNRIQKTLQIMKAMKDICKFRAQSQTQKHNDKIQSNFSPVQSHQQARKCKKSGAELMKCIHEHSFSTEFQHIKSIKATLLNMEQLGKAIRAKKLDEICKSLQKNLSLSLSKMYSRQSWLKSELPKQALMINRMRPQIQAQIQQQSDDGQMNSSYLNISVLDQSYCVGASNISSKKQFVHIIDGKSKQMMQMMVKWKEYCQQYYSKSKKLQQQEQQISEIFHRVTLKFVLTFTRDLQDYINYIYAQKNVPVSFPSELKTRMIYIHPKFFVKIVKLFFESLSLIMRCSLDFHSLPGLSPKLMQTLQQKIKQIINLKQITENATIENKTMEYDDVIEVVTALDFWVQFAQHIADRVQVDIYDQNQQEGDAAIQLMIKFQQNINHMKKHNIQEYFANLHKFALISDLKQSIERQDFFSISIPVSSFSMLQSIINWGQHASTEADNNLGKVNQVEQSFYLNSSMLADAPKKNKLFSIFKVIDRKLIIEGKQFKLCRSILLLFAYIQVYLKAKVDSPALVASTDERICELIGFYIWYCKKMVYSPVAQNQDFHQNINTSTNVNKLNNVQHKQQQVTNPGLYKKTILNLCMLSNMCDLLIKILQILNLSVKPKKLQKVNTDLRIIKQDAFKQISMIPFLQSERQISCLYESRLKTRKEIPTKQSIKLIQVLQQSRNDLTHYFDNNVVKKCLQNSVRIISKNYFGYLCNMQARGKAQLKWFMPKLKDIIQDLFPDDLANLEKHVR